jgi:excisionase family DNA binding protein
MKEDDLVGRVVEILTPAVYAAVKELKADLEKMVAAYAQQSRLPQAAAAGGDGSEYLTVKQAAALLQVKARTLYDWVARDLIPYKRIGDLLRFSRAELIEWIEKNSLHS